MLPLFHCGGRLYIGPLRTAGVDVSSEESLAYTCAQDGGAWCRLASVESPGDAKRWWGRQVACTSATVTHQHLCEILGSNGRSSVSTC